MKLCAFRIGTVFCVLATALPGRTQDFKGHHVGESPAQFFAAEPKLKEKLDQCRNTVPRQLTDDEVRRRYGDKTLQELEKRRTSPNPEVILDKDADVYGDRCFGLLEVANGKDVKIDGTGYDSENMFSKNLSERMAGPESMPLIKAKADNITWLGSDSGSRHFVFKGGVLSNIQLLINAPYEDVVADVTKRLSVPPKEVLTPMHNAYGATWNDPSSTWDTPVVHVIAFENRNPAELHDVVLLRVETHAAYQQELEKLKNRPSTID
jgi:hypothetical protein